VRTVAAIFFCCLLAGCAGQRSYQPLSVAEIELAETPFYPQEQFQCGPAALAALLNTAGVATTPEQLAPRLYLPGREGSLQLELVAAVRRAGRIPYQLRPDPAAIAVELAAGRPVLVLQNLGLRSLPVYHYAVVVGTTAGGETLLLRSGTTRRLELPIADFIPSWERAGSWGLVVLRPGELPAEREPQRYLEALAALEATGRPDLAESGYRALLAREPDQATARFGLANTLFVRGRYGEAERHYRHLLASHPNQPAAVNNLAEALARQNRPEEALALIDNFLARASGDGLTRQLQETRGEIAIKAARRP
jgi:tetratricopeptide (TPR) repeat protein